MLFEQLANELLLDLFDYLDFINLFRAFYDLNHRFNQLIFSQLQKYHLDFRSVPKCDFDLVCQEYLLSIQNQIISLHLSNDVDIPELPQVFLTHGHHVNQFINLKFLSIRCQSFAILKQILNECHQLSYLTRLHIHTNNYDYIEYNYRLLINRIWSLSQLTYCHIDVMYSSSTWFNPMTIISSSILCLITTGTSYTINNLCNLFEHTPNLKRLEIGNIIESHDVPLQTIFPSLTTLRMMSDISIESIKSLFQIVPNLRYLMVQVNNIEFNGLVWEQIFIDYLTNIKRFRLLMNIQFSLDDCNDDIDEQIDELFDSFRTDFWMKKQRWFVRYDRYQMNSKDTIVLYTLPYPLDTFSFIGGCQSKSTNPNDLNQSSSYNQVQTLEHIHNNQYNISYNRILIPIQCANIHHLKLKFPLHEHFWSMISTLDRLISLDVTLYEDRDYSQLQLLLRQTPHLHLLKFCHRNKFSMASFNIYNPSIRRLAFFQNSGFRLHYFDSIECALFTNLPLASQCEILTIDVQNRIDIVKLINNMPNLQAMNVHCRDSIKYRYETAEVNDDLIQWLHNHLSKNYSYSVIRKGYTNIPLINISINRRK